MSKRKGDDLEKGEEVCVPCKKVLGGSFGDDDNVETSAGPSAGPSAKSADDEKGKEKEKKKKAKCTQKLCQKCGRYSKDIFDLTYETMDNDFYLVFKHLCKSGGALDVDKNWTMVFTNEKYEEMTTMTLLRAAAMIADEKVGDYPEQGAMLSLILLAGSNELEGAKEVAGWSPGPTGSCGGSIYCHPKHFALGVLDSCVKPAAERLAGWHDVRRQLKGADREERPALARRLFIERCCAEGQADTLFEDLLAGARASR